MMNTVLSSCVLAAVAILAAGAPTTIHETSPQKKGTPQESLRTKRSNYAAQYAPPCAAASAPVPAFAAAPYQFGLGPAHHQLIQAPQSFGSFGYGYPQYRSDMAEDEMMGFSEMDPVFEHPFARYAYASPSAAHYGAPILQSQPQTSAAGTVFSVFPNANADTGSVALLLSCSPSISSGHIVSTQPAHGPAILAPAAAPVAYREMEEHQQVKEEQAHEPAPLTKEHNVQQT